MGTSVRPGCTVFHKNTVTKDAEGAAAPTTDASDSLAEGVAAEGTNLDVPPVEC